MPSRHKRRSKLFDAEAAQFVRDASEFHRKLSKHLHALKPQAEQYKAILALSEEVFRAVAIASGETPPWAAVRPSTWSSSPSKTSEGGER
jgi:hypothetical protein